MTSHRRIASVKALATEYPKLGLRESAKLDKAARIKAAASELFHAVGFEATTTQAVAQRAGIGTGTLFSYASAKEDLLIIVFMDELMNAASAARNRASRSKDLLLRAYTVYSGLMRYHGKNLDLSRHLVRELAYVKSPTMRNNVALLVHYVRDTVGEYIESEQSSGGFQRGIDCGLIADNCFAIYYNVLNVMLTQAIPLATSLRTLHVRLALQLSPFQERPVSAG